MKTFYDRYGWSSNFSERRISICALNIRIGSVGGSLLSIELRSKTIIRLNWNFQLQASSTFELYWEIAGKDCFLKFIQLSHYTSINLVSYHTTQQFFSLLIFFTVYAKLLIITCFLVLCSVMFQKHLTESGTKVFCLSWGKLVLRISFKNG